MKLKLYTASLCLAFSVSSAIHAQVAPQAAYMQPRADKSILTDIIKTDAGYVVAGERGHILLSTDGATWQQAKVPVQSNLNSVFFVNNQQGWAVGHDVTILHTTNGGQEWQLQKFAPELDKPLFDIVFKNGSEGLAIGAYGLTLRTQDAGATWVQEYHAELANVDDQAVLNELKTSDPAAFEEEANSVLPHLNRIVRVGETLHMVGEGGLYARSNDFGKSWQRHESFYQGSLFGIARGSTGTLVVVGLRGHAFVSRDDGQTWQPLSLQVAATFNSVTATQDGFVISGNSGSLLVSKDDAVSFDAIQQPDGKAVLNALRDAERLITVTEVGIRQNEVTAGKK